MDEPTPDVTPDPGPQPLRGQIVYVGPTIRGTPLHHLDIFADGVPDFVNAALTANPVPGAHFVSLDEYAANPTRWKEAGPAGFKITPVKISRVPPDRRRNRR